MNILYVAAALVTFGFTTILTVAGVGGGNIIVPVLV